MSEAMVFTDPRDPLGRKVTRCEVSTDGTLLLVDLPKRYAGVSGRLTKAPCERALTREDAIYLRAWLDEVIPTLRDADG